MQTITGDTVFEQTEWVVVRPQKGSYLFYNSRTDELHLIPPAGHVVYSLCDGFRSVDEIADELLPHFELTREPVRDRLEKFLGELETRGLLEKANA
jgi:hypothetical protein